MNIGILSSFLKKRPRGTITYLLIYIDAEDEKDNENVFRWSVDETSEEPVETFAEEVLQVSQADTDERGKATRYSFRCLGKDDKILSQKTIKNRANGGQGDPLGIDGAAGKTAAEQMIRMNEVFLRAWNSSQTTIHSSYQAALKDLRTEIESLRVRENQVMEILRETNASRIEADEASIRRGEWLDRVMQIAEKNLPTIAEKIATQIAAATAANENIRAIKK